VAEEGAETGSLIAPTSPPTEKRSPLPQELPVGVIAREGEATVAEAESLFLIVVDQSGSPYPTLWDSISRS
jgi:hypothetical protein